MSDSRKRFNEWLRTAKEPMDTWAMWQAAENAAAAICAELYVDDDRWSIDYLSTLRSTFPEAFQ